MYYLGIGVKDGQIYVGGKVGLRHRLYPYPMLLPLRFEPFEGMIDYPDSRDFAGRLFLEDSFDPVTRVRRGRVYSGGHATRAYVSEHNGLAGDKASMMMYEYQRDPLHKFKELHGARLPLVYLGSEDFRSTWRIVDIEQDSNDTFVVVLKSYRSLGEIPEMKWEEVPTEIKRQVEERIEDVEVSINREGPKNVIDRCRDAVGLIIGHLIQSPGKDLNDAIDAYSRHESGKHKKLVQHASHTIRILHSRGKPNVEHKLQTPPLVEEDAQLAVRCFGTILKEVGWAN
ncbi:hypothetical protein [Coraliomargarita sinensis]|nr:hypothetical protein [Coraliomargarita sinensis]